MELNGYVLEDVVADGRTGRVYRAIRKIDGGRVIVRQIRPDFLRDSSVRASILALPRDVAGVTNPVILLPLDTFEAGGALCVVEDWVEGRTLKQAMAVGRLSQEDAITMALDVLDGLTELHSRGLYHGDISPQNLVNTSRGTRLTGLQVAVRTGRRKVSSAFLRDAWEPPEVAGGGRPTATTDLFSLGACLHAGLTGEESWQTLPPALDPLTASILRAMAPEGAQRYPDAQTFRAAILALRKAPTAEDSRPKVRPAPRPAEVKDDRARRKVVLAAAFGILGLALLGILWQLWPDVPDGMVAIPAGTHSLGDAGGSGHERPGFRWTHGRFFLDRAEVTVGQYERCVKTGDCIAVEGRLSRPQTEEDAPRVGVTWLQAQAFCRFSERRLPTENEWEAAARTWGGIHPWGDALPSCESAVYGQGDGGHCPPVGPKGVRVEPEGGPQDRPVDLAGNAWEWVDSDYTDHRKPGSGERGETGGSATKVIKGGAWSTGPRELRSASRLPVPTDHWAADLGFRCALTLD